MKKIFAKTLTIFVSLNLIFTSYLPFLPVPTPVYAQEDPGAGGACQYGIISDCGRKDCDTGINGGELVCMRQIQNADCSIDYSPNYSTGESCGGGGGNGDGGSGGGSVCNEGVINWCEHTDCDTSRNLEVCWIQSRVIDSYGNCVENNWRLGDVTTTACGNNQGGGNGGGGACEETIASWHVDHQCNGQNWVWMNEKVFSDCHTELISGEVDDAYPGGSSCAPVNDNSQDLCLNTVGNIIDSNVETRCDGNHWVQMGRKIIDTKCTTDLVPVLDTQQSCVGGDQQPTPTPEQQYQQQCGDAGCVNVPVIQYGCTPEDTKSYYQCSGSAGVEPEKGYQKGYAYRVDQTCTNTTDSKQISFSAPMDSGVSDASCNETFVDYALATDPTLALGSDTSSEIDQTPPRIYDAITESGEWHLENPTYGHECDPQWGKEVYIELWKKDLGNGKSDEYTKASGTFVPGSSCQLGAGAEERLNYNAGCDQDHLQCDSSRNFMVCTNSWDTRDGRHITQPGSVTDIHCQGGVTHQTLVDANAGERCDPASHHYYNLEKWLDYDNLDADGNPTPLEKTGTDTGKTCGVILSAVDSSDPNNRQVYEARLNPNSSNESTFTSLGDNVYANSDVPVTVAATIDWAFSSNLAQINQVQDANQRLQLKQDAVQSEADKKAYRDAVNAAYDLPQDQKIATLKTLFSLQDSNLTDDQIISAINEKLQSIGITAKGSLDNSTIAVSCDPALGCMGYLTPEQQKIFNQQGQDAFLGGVNLVTMGGEKIVENAINLAKSASQLETTYEGSGIAARLQAADPIKFQQAMDAVPKPVEGGSTEEYYRLLSLKMIALDKELNPDTKLSPTPGAIEARNQVEVATQKYLNEDKAVAQEAGAWTAMTLAGSLGGEALVGVVSKGASTVTKSLGLAQDFGAMASDIGSGIQSAWNGAKSAIGNIFGTGAKDTGEAVVVQVAEKVTPEVVQQVSYDLGPKISKYADRLKTTEGRTNLLNDIQKGDVKDLSVDEVRSILDGGLINGVEDWTPKYSPDRFMNPDGTVNQDLWDKANFETTAERVQQQADVAVNTPEGIIAAKAKEAADIAAAKAKIAADTAAKQAQKAQDAVDLAAQKKTEAQQVLDDATKQYAEAEKTNAGQLQADQAVEQAKVKLAESNAAAAKAAKTANTAKTGAHTAETTQATADKKAVVAAQAQVDADAKVAAKLDEQSWQYLADKNAGMNVAEPTVGQTVQEAAVAPQPAPQNIFNRIGNWFNNFNKEDEYITTAKKNESLISDSGKSINNLGDEILAISKKSKADGVTRSEAEQAAADQFNAAFNDLNANIQEMKAASNSFRNAPLSNNGKEAALTALNKSEAALEKQKTAINDLLGKVDGLPEADQAKLKTLITDWKNSEAEQQQLKAFEAANKEMAQAIEVKYPSTQPAVQNPVVVQVSRQAVVTEGERVAVLNRLETKINQGTVDEEVIGYWKGLVRDSEGRWEKYAQNPNTAKVYFYGTQPKPDLTNQTQLKFIQSSIEQEKAFVKGLEDGSFKGNFKEWLQNLHKMQSYKGDGGVLINGQAVAGGAHTSVVKDEILSLAQKYGDPYQVKKVAQSPILPGIEPKGLPVDIWVVGDKVIHYYPDPKYYDQYFAKMEESLQKFKTVSANGVSEDALSAISQYYQYAVNTRMFTETNQALFANQANAMLKELGFKPVEQGILDFVAMRLQPKNFTKYFIDEVTRVNPGLPTEIAKDQAIKIAAQQVQNLSRPSVNNARASIFNTIGQAVSDFWNGLWNIGKKQVGGQVKGISTTATSQEQQTQFVDANTFELLVKKNLIKQQLAATGQVSMDYVRQLLKEEIIKPETQKTDNGYILTTGKSGSVNSEIVPGKYNLSITGLDGMDIQIPKQIDVATGSAIMVPIILKTGTGKVEKIDSIRQPADKTNQGKTNISVIVSSSDKKVLPFAGLQLVLAAAVSQKSINLVNGWNLITLNSKPEKLMTASSLVEEVAKQGGYITAVSTLEDGAWQTYVARGDKNYSLIDFVIEPGKAYFVKATRRSAVTFDAQDFDTPVKLKLTSGWNAVGIPMTTKGYKASEVIDNLNKINLGADTMSKWNFGLWDTFVEKGTEQFGDNFAVISNQGMILKVNQGGEYIP